MIIVYYVLCTSELFGDDVHHITIGYRHTMNQRDETELQIIEPLASDLNRGTNAMKLAILSIQENPRSHKALISRIQYAFIALVELILFITKNHLIRNTSLHQIPSTCRTQRALVGHATLFMQ